MISKRPTIDDVARLAGVSIKTVSRVFNQAPNVRQATHDKVVSAAESLNYRPNLSARQLASNRTFLVGMLYDNPDPQNENDYVTAVQSGSLQACRENGYHLLISPCQADSADLIREVIGLSRQVDGFIVLQPLSDLWSLNRHLLENDVAWNFLAFKLRDRVFENLHASIERLGKALLFFLQDFLDVRLRFLQLGIGIAHLLCERRDQFVEEQLVGAELLAVANGAADDAAQHVAPALVAWQHAVDDQEGAGADMIGDDVQRTRTVVLDTECLCRNTPTSV